MVYQPIEICSHVNIDVKNKDFVAIKGILQHIDNSSFNYLYVVSVLFSLKRIYRFGKLKKNIGYNKKEQNIG